MDLNTSKHIILTITAEKMVKIQEILIHLLLVNYVIKA